MFTKSFSKNISTVKLLDDFDQSEEKELRLMRVLRFYKENILNEKCYELDLYISHAFDVKKQNYIKSRITMSNLKEIAESYICLKDITEIRQLEYCAVPKMSMPIYHFLFNKKKIFMQTIDMMEQIGQKQSGKISFEPAIVLNAQNSKNLTGYGSEYYYGELIYEGTLYGETTTYVITDFELIQGQ